ncbi:C40 family peptidase [Brevibacillus centrosporus]|uniref:NlpC/P60 family protein n=1 Tax=Brevibacillus centrosporus TaxID=54910 RepID=A0A1I4E6U9_9BACL|nr:C40 family peptidase [Brevibacillus centrosporus]SFK99901.1 NlpC/P60 family protein [Brevibacillus centrosporus]
MEISYVNVAVSNLWSSIDSVLEVDFVALSTQVDIRAWFSQLPIQNKYTASRVSSQLLYGEPVIIDKKRGTWFKVHAPNQYTKKSSKGYPGWIPSRHLSFNSDYHQLFSSGPLAYVITATTYLEMEDGFSLELSFMTKLPYLRTELDHVIVLTPSGKEGRIAKSDVKLNLKTEASNDMNLLSVSMQFLKTPFIGGGASSFGFDCSGLMFRLFESRGIAIPRDVGDQKSCGEDVPLKEIEVGDLLFFCIDQLDKERVSHVGLYLGSGNFISSRRTGLPIRISSISEEFYATSFWGAKRYSEKEKFDLMY